MTGKLAGGSIRVLWDASDSAEVTITGGTAAWTVNGSAVTFPYTLSSSTTFETAHSGTYTVSVEHHGYEIAGTPDGTVEVSLRFGEQHVFEPTVDGPGHGASSVATQMTSLINDADSAPGAALRETFVTKGQMLRPQSVVPFGDSIVAHGETTVSMDGGSHLNYTCRGWWNYANQLLGARFTILDPSGIVGDTLANMLARVQVDVLDRAPGWVWMDGGINDVRSGRTFAQIVADLDNLFGQFADAGIRVLMTTLVPDTSLTSAQHAIRDDVNHWLNMYAEANPNVILADAAAPLRDPAAAGASSTLTYDGLHPVADGHMRMAKVVADALAPHSSPRPPVLTGADSRNLLGATGMLNGNAGTGIATGWNKVFGGTDSTYSKVARTDGIPGEWQQIVTPNGANWAMIFPTTDPTVTPGTVYECSVEWQAEGYDPAPSGVMSLQLQMLFLDSVDGIVGGFNSNYIVFSDKMRYLPGGAASGIAVTPRIAAPSTATQVRLAIRCEGGGTRRFARATVRKF